MLYGCDISHWQGKDFDISEQDFIIAKATEGKTYIDDCFHHNINKALKANKCIGAYHFARPDNNTPKEEAKNFVDTIKPYIGKCLLALDWEADAWNYPITWALEWLQEVERLTGVKPLIYASASKIEECKVIAENGNGLWCAKWSETAPKYKPTFTVMAIWQYTASPYDKDKFFGNKETWQKYCDTNYVENGNEHPSKCEFCTDFEMWLNEHGYYKR